jgi:cytochrome oxidase Cu insertion factor (SCO1/SenC/PrrC family)
MRSKQTTLWGILALALIGVAAASLVRGPGARLMGGGGAPRAGGSGGAAGDLALYGQVPDFALVSQTGDTVRLADLRGTVWIGDFIFTHCASTCPMMTAQLRRLQDSLGEGAPVRLVSFSVDPERDTPQRLSEYAAGYGATPDRWLFLTGEKAEIRSLAVDGFHVTVTDPSPEELAQGAEAVMHSTRLALVDGQGRIRGYYDGADEQAVQQLGTDVRRLLAQETS